MDCEVLIQPNTALRGEKMLRSMVEAAESAGVNAYVSDRWTGRSQVMMTYGLGHLQRRGWQEAHKRAGGTVVGWDLGYWNREVPLQFGMRLTINDDHPHKRIRPMPPDRWAAAGIELRNDYDPKGPIILVGLGKKQRMMMDVQGTRWEQRKLAELRSRGREVVYRPKRPEKLFGIRTMYGPIESVLKGASLVVCHHSNVAVDGCIAGVPVECADGAALALYRDNPNPSSEQRLSFLQSLAYWQWNPTESKEAWRFIREQLAC